MALKSQLFSGNKRLRDCLVQDSAHVTPGSKGQHVSLIQYAVLALEGGTISGDEIVRQVYGPTTTKAVYAYKKRRKIINFSYQTAEDNIVGKMTIAALDREMVLVELAEQARGIVRRF